MQKAQLSLGEVHLAAEGIQQLKFCANISSWWVEHQGHRIHREIPTRQVLLEAPGSHHGIGARLGIKLLPG
jgi:hypothetical protein